MQAHIFLLLVNLTQQLYRIVDTKLGSRTDSSEQVLAEERIEIESKSDVRK